MAVEQRKAQDTLEKWISLNVSAEPLLKLALEDKDAWVFAELRNDPRITGLGRIEDAKAEKDDDKRTQDSQWHKLDDMTGEAGLLNVFSYGTWKDYTERKTSHKLRNLSEKETQKLKLLSIPRLCSSHTNLRYTYLQETLEVPTVPELEKLAINAIYAGLIDATLNPKDQRLEVRSVAPFRDIVPGGIQDLKNTLAVLSSNCEGQIVDLEAQVAEIHKNARIRAEKTAAREQQIKQAIEKEDKSGSKRLGDEGDDADMMDVDEESTGKKALRNLKKGAFGLRRG